MNANIQYVNQQPMKSSGFAKAALILILLTFILFLILWGLLLGYTVGRIGELKFMGTVLFGYAIFGLLVYGLAIIFGIVGCIQKGKKRALAIVVIILSLIFGLAHIITPIVIQSNGWNSGI